MSTCAGGWATGVNLGGAADQCDQDQTDGRPNCLHSLTGGDECDDPTYENGRAEIEQSADTKIENREAIDPDEGRVHSREKNSPTRPQNETGNKVGRSEK